MTSWSTEAHSNEERNPDEGPRSGFWTEGREKPRPSNLWCKSNFRTEGIGLAQGGGRRENGVGCPGKKAKSRDKHGTLNVKSSLENLASRHLLC